MPLNSLHTNADRLGTPHLPLTSLPGEVGRIFDYCERQGSPDNTNLYSSVPYPTLSTLPILLALLELPRQRGYAAFWKLPVFQRIGVYASELHELELDDKR